MSRGVFGSGRSRMVGGWMAGTFGFGVESEIIENLAEVLERKEGRKEEGVGPPKLRRSASIVPLMYGRCPSSESKRALSIKAT